MAITSIALQVDNARAGSGRLASAVALASRHRARLLGVYAAPHPQTGVIADSRQDVQRLAAEQRRLDELAERARTSFAEATAGAALDTEWYVAEYALADTLRRHAAYADLVVIGQHDDSDPLCTSRGLAEDLVLHGGRPVLIVPYTGAPSTIGRRVMVAWNGGPAAARATHDALPLLVEAEQVDVVVFDRDSEHAADATAASERLCAHLAGHGVRALPHHIVGTDVNVPDQLLSRANDWSTDLIVMGGYEHSRLRAVVLGSGTRAVLEHMTVPALMTH